MKKYSVVLVEPNNSGNVGAVARAMANFGFSNLILINPRCKIDDSARDRAKHAQKVLDNVKIKKVFSDVIDNFDLVVGTTGIIGSDYNIPRSPILSSELSKMINKKNGNVALVFGREDDGLYQKEINSCDFIVHIPSKNNYPVLNLSHAVAIVLYELSENEVRGAHKLVTQNEKKQLFDVIDELIEQEKFRTSQNKETQRTVWKKVISKSLLTKREAFAMIGFLKKLKK